MQEMVRTLVPGRTGAAGVDRAARALLRAGIHDATVAAAGRALEVEAPAEPGRVARALGMERTAAREIGRWTHGWREVEV